MSGVTVNGQPGATGRLNAIDAAGEAVGQVVDGSGAASADYAGLFVAAAGNLPAGAPQVVSSLGSVSMFSLNGISATWEQGPGSGSTVGYVDYNRQTQDATATGFEGLEGPGACFADTGLIAGYLLLEWGQCRPVPLPPWRRQHRIPVAERHHAVHLRPQRRRRDGRLRLSELGV